MMQAQLGSMVIYQLFLRAFDKRGTLVAAKEHLPKLARLGVDVIYLCPITVHDREQDIRHFSERMKRCGLEAPTNPYRLSDYFLIDAEYGTEDDLSAFVACAHQVGIRVILDLVYLHCGPTASFIEEHPDFVMRNDEGEISLTDYGFPRINFVSPALREYLWENMLYYIKRFDVDGFRCDCGDSVPLPFWQEGVRRVKEVKPHVLMLNEGDKEEALTVFDLNYGGAWTHCINACLRGEKIVEELRRVYESIYNPVSKTTSRILAIDNHDYTNDAYEERLERCVASDKIEGAMILSAMLPGTFFLYNGQELADGTRHSIFATRFNAPHLGIDRSCEESPKAVARYDFLSRLIALRHASCAVATGDLQWCHTDAHTMAFMRVEETETLFVAVNLGTENSTISLSIQGDALFSHRAQLHHTHLTLSSGGYCIIRKI